MKKRVLIIDDSFRRNVCELVGPRYDLSFMPIKDKQRRQIQTPVKVKISYTGACLKQAVTRAKRWLRSNGPMRKAPKHIVLAMMAFSTADNKGFRTAMRGETA